MSRSTAQSEQAILQKLAGSDPEDIRSAAFDAGEMKLEAASELLVRHLHSQNLGVQEAAESALRQIRGAAVVSAVAPLLRSEEAPIRNSAMDILREISADDMKVMNRLLNDADPDIRIFAADILGSSTSTLALPLLAENLFSEPEVNVRYQICISLGTLGLPEAAPILRKALQDDEEWVQFAAVEALAKLRADSCASILIEALKASSELVASMIINALGEMGNMRAVPILLQQLDEVSGPLRNKALKAIVQILGAPSLSLFAPKDLETFRAYLIVALEDEDEEIIDAALTGLCGVGEGDLASTRAVLSLVERLDPVRGQDLLQAACRCLIAIGYTDAFYEGLMSDNDTVKQLIVEACGTVGCRRCVGLLVDLFFTLDNNMQRTVISHLRHIADTSDVSFFMEVLEQVEDPEIIKECLYFIGNQIRCTHATEELLAYLDHPSDEVKEAALEACLALEDEATNKKLIGLFSERDPLKRMMATYAMGRINPLDYLEELSMALEDAVADIRKLALEAIGSICHGRPELLSQLAPRMSDESREVRLALVELAGTLPDMPLTMSLLEQALADQDNWVRIRALEALGERKATEALPLLIQMLEDSDLLVMLKIIEALGVIGGKVAFRALLSLTGHADPDVQQAVAEAIAHIREEQGDDI